MYSQTQHAVNAFIHAFILRKYYDSNTHKKLVLLLIIVDITIPTTPGFGNAELFQVLVRRDFQIAFKAVF